MNYFNPNWKTHHLIKAFTTTTSQGNMGLHATNEPEVVLANRSELFKNNSKLASPAWLNQVHGTDVIKIKKDIQFTQPPTADASITKEILHPLVIMTADCFPILLCNSSGTEIAAIHAGWRGAVNGIIENTINNMQSESADLQAWIGPGICTSCFEVGDDVYKECTKKYNANQFFIKKNNNKYLFNLAEFIGYILQENNVSKISFSNACTFENDQLFYSYRRNNNTGRMATFIWINY